MPLAIARQLKRQAYLTWFHNRTEENWQKYIQASRDAEPVQWASNQREEKRA